MPVTPARTARPRFGREGIALPLALLGLVAVTLLVTAALVTSSTETAISNAHVDASTSLYGADDALNMMTVDQFREIANNTGAGFVDGDSANFSLITGASYRVRVARMFLGPITEAPLTRRVRRDETYQLISYPAPRPDGTPGRGRVVSAMIDVRREGPNPNLSIEAGASIAADTVRVNGSIVLSGRQDTNLCASGSNVNAVDLAAGVVAEIDPRNVDGGAAEVQRDTLSKRAFALRILGGNDPEALARIANIKFGRDGFSPFAAGWSPDSDTYSRTDPNVDRWRLNWGCPYQIENGCNRDADTAYYPVIALRNVGSAVNPGDGHGQGILLVEGDLHLNSGFRFNGIVIVMGDLQVNGNAQIQGALVALGDVLLNPERSGGAVDPNGETFTGNGNALVRYNSCNVNKAIESLRQAGITNAPQQALSSPKNWFEVVR